MKHAVLMALGGMALMLAACGPNAATRATTGAAVGAVAAGPVGAVGGAALGGSGAVKIR